MTEETWRDLWSPFRVALIDETARCWVSQQAAASKPAGRDWSAVTRDEQRNIADYIASVFLAMDEAMMQLDERGGGIWSGS
ncbi:hypothetical protein [Microbacterium aerolatum]|uniref:hypothetical protein n=1 Tax=Microbacterium aerolatum TaxID=153731 RepID=UPI00384FE915